MIGFILMTSGCKEKETFWLFASLMSYRMDKSPKMGGLYGLYTQGFPVLIKMLKIFDVLFE